MGASPWLEGNETAVIITAGAKFIIYIQMQSSVRAGRVFCVCPAAPIFNSHLLYCTTHIMGSVYIFKNPDTSFPIMMRASHFFVLPPSSARGSLIIGCLVFCLGKLANDDNLVCGAFMCSGGGSDSPIS